MKHDPFEFAREISITAATIEYGDLRRDMVDQILRRKMSELDGEVTLHERVGFLLQTIQWIADGITDLGDDYLRLRVKEAEEL